ncbi:MAG: 16S rRNA (guanine(966)-N(2))-methyltransferase RsmD [Emcibacteraceae bacterium]|nr:16S rRNA (guanine(966)-N(2))-methyltransferase RsmD [Emcibacteraceae bacterium]MDG1857951.1 16S rRNA (guanine(966)-N(2))-methyltransferase RsmD [Emcibacteraceae bacterium]
MRIIGGTYRGKKLITPPNAAIRPTTDRMRETLFNMLEHGAGPGIRGSRILDLFAGTGALGIEALSRNAEHVTFVDYDRSSMQLVKNNTALIGNPDNTSYITLDGTKITASQAYDIILIDPPYNKGLILLALQNILERSLLSEGGVIVIEYSSSEEMEIPSQFSEIKKKKMGEATFSILELTL